MKKFIYIIAVLPAMFLNVIFAAGMEPQSFDAEWLMLEGSATMVMPVEVRSGQKIWISSLPFEGEKRFFIKKDLAWTEFGSFVFHINLPEENAADDKTTYELIAYIKDVDFWWYQKLLPYTLKNGTYSEIVVPLHSDLDKSGGKYCWRPKGHKKPFDDSCMRKVREFGIIIFKSASNDNRDAISETVVKPDGRFEVSNFRLIPKETAPSLVIHELIYPATCPQYECFEISFNLNKNYANPFDPAEIDISAEFTSPSGRKQNVYGFWYQNYIRRLKGRLEDLRPVGEPMWKIRFTPTESGIYSYIINVKDRDGAAVSASGKFFATQGVRDGFVRVSATDYHYFEFDNGRFFYPITLNLHGTYDYRYIKMIRKDEIPLEDRRSYFYEDRFRKMAKAGMNGTEIWISSWGYEIEWRGDWIGWAGLGQYSLENAWRLDHTMKLAEELGIYINLVMSCHGAYCYGENNTIGDAEWQNSPFYTGNGGWLKVEDINKMFTDERVFNAIKNKVRYIVARYAHSTSIWCWEIISESDLVPIKVCDTQRQFIWKYAQYIRDIDPYKHPLTNHYCGIYTHYDQVMFRHPIMDLASGDAYRGGVSKDGNVFYQSFPKHLVEAAKYLDMFKKPAVANECGGTWSAGPLPLLEADIRALNWAAFMTTLGGAPQTWWEDVVDENYWYDYYAAFARYQSGEDKRAKNLVTYDEPVIGSNGKPVPDLFCLSLRNDKQAYVWIYDDREYSYGPLRIAPDKNAHFETFKLPVLNPTRQFTDITVNIPNLLQGKYVVEVWDTCAGKVIEIMEVENITGNISVKLPTFSKDIALKIKSVLY